MELVRCELYKKSNQILLTLDGDEEVKQQQKKRAQQKEKMKGNIRH